MPDIPTCSTCSSALIDKFDGASVRWLCPQCDRLTLMFVKEEQDFWTGQADTKLIGYQWNKLLNPPPENSA
ncbi:hypothetical protein [Leptolyngbya ohadii]|uniref:hypothetical protein n=1 Tax=Leptolyngbya ohadii TaxID=1962290 RepID=UPI000B5A1796|nr:hypothetical protein [Leptolyngbya ohadii]